MICLKSLTIATATAPRWRQANGRSTHDAIGEPTVADAILDRLVHNAHRITLAGESMRKTRSRLTTKSQSE
ncbi:ATP-binding protein [Burkholderia ambifaria]|uniref:ATP-binding protein n=1 Tax=Burkholderia ambifaria TaxID=152480 RepID=UPI00031847E5|nr:ATP-binding protein [Burkholderia ambifaria]